MKNYAIELLEEQIDLIQDELRFSDGEERKQLEQRLLNCIDAVQILKPNESKTVNRNEQAKNLALIVVRLKKFRLNQLLMIVLLAELHGKMIDCVR